MYLYVCFIVFNLNWTNHSEYKITNHEFNYSCLKIGIFLCLCLLNEFILSFWTVHICPTLVLRNSKMIFLITNILWVGSPQIEDIICGFTSLMQRMALKSSLSITCFPLEIGDIFSCSLNEQLLLTSPTWICILLWLDSALASY